MKNARRVQDCLKEQLKNVTVRNSYECETAEILRDKRLMAAVRQGITEAKALCARPKVDREGGGR